MLLLPAIADLLQSKFEVYVNTACNSLRLILKNFATVIKTNIESPTQSVGVDISRQERSVNINTEELSETVFKTVLIE